MQYITILDHSQPGYIHQTLQRGAILGCHWNRLTIQPEQASVIDEEIHQISCIVSIASRAFILLHLRLHRCMHGVFARPFQMKHPVASERSARMAKYVCHKAIAFSDSWGRTVNHGLICGWFTSNPNSKPNSLAHICAAVVRNTRTWMHSLPSWWDCRIMLVRGWHKAGINCRPNSVNYSWSSKPSSIRVAITAHTGNIYIYVFTLLQRNVLATMWMSRQIQVSSVASVLSIWGKGLDQIVIYTCLTDSGQNGFFYHVRARYITAQR